MLVVGRSYHAVTADVATGRIDELSLFAVSVSDGSLTLVLCTHFFTLPPTKNETDIQENQHMLVGAITLLDQHNM